jgi:hypothetical protein
MSDYVLPDDYRDKFNFYLYTGGYGTEEGCSGTVPEGYYTDVPDVDTTGILRDGSGGGGCANSEGTGTKFQAPGRHGGVVIHESGHAIFDLIDEYCGDTWYPSVAAQLPDMTNVWLSEEDCEAAATAEGWAGGLCTEIETLDTDCTPDADDVWKYDNDWCVMDSADIDFDLACSRRIAHFFENVVPSWSEGILIKLHIAADDTISFLGAHVVEGHPDINLHGGPLTIEILLSNGQPFDSFRIWDPRVEKGDGGNFNPEIDFQIIVPYHEGYSAVTISDTETGEEKIHIPIANVERCNEGTDNDGDGLIDCMDPDCEWANCDVGNPCAQGKCSGGMCMPSRELCCNDGIDNDGDGDTDCADLNCEGRICDDGGLCTEGEGLCSSGACEDVTEMCCDDAADNDQDGVADCDDADCAGNPVCMSLQVRIDVKPGSYPNCFNVNGAGVIPVAILGSADFDVSRIDISTLTFAGLNVRVKNNGDLQCSVEDVSGNFDQPEGMPDGYPDLVCKFVDDPAFWSQADGTATLTGRLIDTSPFEGMDEICTVP